MVYELQGSDAAAFSITAGGQIFTAGALDYETRSFYEFVVTTTDGTNSLFPSSSATVRVSVVVSRLRVV